MKKRDYKKEFCALISQLAPQYSKWKIWTDFLDLSAISMANVIPTPEMKAREEKYHSIINSYRKEEQEIFAQMLSLVVLALEDNPAQDFLGSLYHNLELHQEQKGQFFTPYHISEFMSELQSSEKDTNEIIQKNGYISVCDPACGAGAMLIAFANVAKKHNINYQTQVLFVAQDIDHTAAMMCYIQLSLLGCPAIIAIGNSITEPFPHPNNDVWYTLFYYLNRQRFTSEVAEENQQDCVDPTNKINVTIHANNLSENLKMIESADGQFVLDLENIS